MTSLALKKACKDVGVVFLEDTNTHQHRMEINSETSDKIYIVSQTKKAGIWQCACWGFRRWQHCKHLSTIVPLIESAIKAIEAKSSVRKKKTKSKAKTTTIRKKASKKKASKKVK